MEETIKAIFDSDRNGKEIIPGRDVKLVCHGCHHQSTEDSLVQAIAFFTKNPTAIEGHAEIESELCVECHEMQTVGHDVHFLEHEVACV